MRYINWCFTYLLTYLQALNNSVEVTGLILLSGCLIKNFFFFFSGRALCQVGVRKERNRAMSERHHQLLLYLSNHVYWSTSVRNRRNMHWRRCHILCHVSVNSSCYLFAFTASTLLVGRKSIRPARKCWYVGGSDLTAALHVLKFQLAAAPSPSSLSAA